jgi:hypothetical protein
MVEIWAEIGEVANKGVMEMTETNENNNDNDSVTRACWFLTPAGLHSHDLLDTAMRP